MDASLVVKQIRESSGLPHVLLDIIDSYHLHVIFPERICKTNHAFMGLIEDDIYTRDSCNQIMCNGYGTGMYCTHMTRGIRKVAGYWLLIKTPNAEYLQHVLTDQTIALPHYCDVQIVNGIVYYMSHHVLYRLDGNWQPECLSPGKEYQRLVKLGDTLMLVGETTSIIGHPQKPCKEVLFYVWKDKVYTINPHTVRDDHFVFYRSKRSYRTIYARKQFLLLGERKRYVLIDVETRKWREVQFRVDTYWNLHIAVHNRNECLLHEDEDHVYLF